MPTRILVLASDAQLRATVARWLMAAGYGVELAESVRRAKEVLANGAIELAIVAPAGLGTGGDAGPMQEVQALRAAVRHLISIGDQAQGATDPPFQPDVSVSAASAQHDLVSRIRAALEAPAAAAEPGEASPVRFAGHTLDPGGRTLRNAGGQEVALTRAEFSLLLALVRQAGRVLSREELSQAALGRASEPDDRSVDVLISRLRRKVEPEPKTPRIILTVPGGGYKLGVAAQAISSAPPPPPAIDAPKAALTVDAPAGLQPVSGGETIRAAAPHEPSPPRRRSIGMSPTLAIATALVALAGIAGLIIAFRSIGPGWRATTTSAAPAQKFDAASIPLVMDLVRTQLSDYERAPPAKAIAISREGWGLSAGATDQAAAGIEALERCRERDKGGFCRLYAVGDNVVWSGSALPLPLAADIRTDTSAMSAVNAKSLDKLWESFRHTAPWSSAAAEYVRARDHKAMAIGLTNSYRAHNNASREEAIRLAVERCSDFARAPCLLISVDGVWTLEIPRSYAITAPFTLAGEVQMSEAERQRVAQIYAGPDWRALARGRSGWYPVAGRDSEAAAVDAALNACRAAEADCVLHAIGNWRVGEKLDGRGDPVQPTDPPR